MSHILVKFGINKKAILKEDESTYTYQNVFNYHQVIDELGLKSKTAIICHQAFHVRRGLMDYQWPIQSLDLWYILLKQKALINIASIKILMELNR